ncbi:MAG: prepilin peptidase [Oligoflexia bacterium]|nr:prepilin peptidase [Oligoflexia bacterium]
MDEFPVLSSFAVFFLGLIIGSFLNVVICRLPDGGSILKPASRCPSCLVPIRWYDNIPLLSWCALRGKCRSCRAPISVRYPLIELMTALLFLAAKLKFGLTPVLMIRELPFLAILIAVTFIDLEHRIIPDELSLGGLVLGLVSTFFLHASLAWPMSVLGALLGFGIFFGLSWAYLRLAGRAGLGGGDVKLLAMIGAFLGPAGVFATVLISSVSGSLVGLGWAWWARRHGISLEGPSDQPSELEDQAAAAADTNLLAAAIPYGPFLVIGAIYYHLLGDFLWFQFTIPT